MLRRELDALIVEQKYYSNLEQLVLRSRQNKMDKKISEEMQNKISKVQILEQRLQSYIMQKQAFQGNLLEVENALGEMDGSNEVFKIVGNIMLKVEKEKISKELKDKKEILDKKIAEIDKQEAKIKEEVLPLQEELMSSFKDEK